MFFTWFLIFQQSSLSSQYNVNKAAPVLCLSLIVMHCHGRKDNCHRSSSSPPLIVTVAKILSLTFIITRIIALDCHGHNNNCHIWSSSQLYLSSSQRWLSWSEGSRVCSPLLQLPWPPQLPPPGRKVSWSLVKLLKGLSVEDNIYLWV